MANTWTTKWPDNVQVTVGRDAAIEDELKAAMASLRAAIPPGYKLVPIKPDCLLCAEAQCDECVPHQHGTTTTNKRREPAGALSHARICESLGDEQADPVVKAALWDAAALLREQEAQIERMNALEAACDPASATPRTEAIPDAEQGDFDCPKAAAARACPCGSCRALRKPPLPRINIECEITTDDRVIGSTFLRVIRVEQEDDGSITAVTDHWPSLPAGDGAQEIVSWARPLYATEPAEGWEPGELVDIEFNNRADKPEGEGWRPLVFADAGDGARVTDIMVREALAHCPFDLTPTAKWAWLADKLNAYLADPSQMDRDGAESDARVAAFFAARETSNGARVTEAMVTALRTIDLAAHVLDRRSRPAMAEDLRAARTVIAAALAARDAQGTKP